MTANPDPFLLQGLRQSGNRSPLAELGRITAAEFIESFSHGDLPRWLETLKNLPNLEPDSVDLKSQVRIGSAPGTGGAAEELERMLRQFIPWRKGPFDLFGVQIESEEETSMRTKDLNNAVAQHSANSCTMIETQAKALGEKLRKSIKHQSHAMKKLEERRRDREYLLKQWGDERYRNGSPSTFHVNVFVRSNNKMLDDELF